MRIERIETLAGDEAGDHVVLRQSFSVSKRRLRSSVLMVAGILLALPIAAVLADDGARAQLAQMCLDAPLAVAQLAFCALIAAAAFGAGLSDISRADLTQRTIAIDPDGIVAEDIIRRRATRWREPISAYRGLRHRVATTTDGARHVLTLEHEDAARSVEIAVAPYISEALIVQTADRFGLPVLAPVILSQSSAWRRIVPKAPRFHVSDTRVPATNAGAAKTADDLASA